MSLLRVTAGLPYTGGLDRDISEQVFHFNVTEGQEGPAAESVLDALQAFYNGVGNPLGDYLAHYVDRSAAFLRGAFIDIDTNLQVGPTFQVPLTLSSETDTGSLPAEVALCLSFASDINTAAIRRRRGRVYMGPFVSNDAVSQTALEYSRPSSALVTALIDAATGLWEAGIGSEGLWLWTIFSRAGAQLHDVTRVWVDNEWDTQRRRGADPTTRTFANLVEP